MNFLVVLSITALLGGCSYSSTTTQADSGANTRIGQTLTQTPVPVPEPSNDEKKRFSESISGIKGLIVLNEGFDRLDDLIRFYNDDGTLWYEFTFYYDDSDGHFEYENDNFRPYLFQPDYFTLALKITGETADRYEVIVNEATGLNKYVKKSAKNLKFESWEDHILGTFAVQFDVVANPLRTSPNGEPRTIDLAKVDRFRADKFDGEWLRVKWDVERNPNSDPALTDSAWIRWREGDILLIEWFYIA